MVMKTLDPDPEFTLGRVPSQAAEEAGPRLATRERTSKPMVVALGILVLIVGAVAFYLYGPRRIGLPEQVLPSPPASNPAPPARQEPAIQHPVEKIPVPTGDATGAQLPLPELDGSDVVAKDAIATILNSDAFVRFSCRTGSSATLSLPLIICHAARLLYKYCQSSCCPGR